MGSILEHAAGIAEAINAAAVPGLVATHDPARAASLGTCVLVPPPVIDYTARTNVYRLACLTDQPAGSLAALAALDKLVNALLSVPGIHPERAEPSAYALAPDRPAVPAYLITITT